MKILFVQGTEKISGGEKVSLDIATSLRKDFDFTFFLPQRPSGDAISFYRGFQVFYPQKNGAKRIYHEFVSVVHQIRPDIIHAQGIRAAVFVKAYYFFHKKNEKFIYTLHGIHFLHKNWLKRAIWLSFEKFTNKFVDILICVGKQDFDSAKKLSLVSESRIVLIKNGIPFREGEAADPMSFRTEIHADNKIVISTISRLHPQKDIETIIRAIELLKEKPVILVVAGDGPQRTDLEHLVSEFHLGDKVFFLGFRKDTKRILLGSDIFVLSSRWEGLPMVILEAFAFKKPVVASAVSGIRELIKDGENGFLFPLGDAVELAKKLELLIADANLRKKIGESGFLFGKINYNQQDMINGYDSLYKKIGMM